MRQVVSFKRDVYRRVMKEFAAILLNEPFIQPTVTVKETPVEVISSPSSDKKAVYKFPYKKRKGKVKFKRR